jgi:hypothetical protein
MEKIINKNILAFLGFLFLTKMALGNCPVFKDDDLINFEYALKQAKLKKVMGGGYRKVFEYDNGIWFMETTYWRVLTGIGLKTIDAIFIEEIGFLKMQKIEGKVRCYYLAEISKLHSKDDHHKFIGFRMSY